MTNFVFKTLPWILATLLFAGFVHFIAVLILPHIATRNAYERLAVRGERNAMVLLRPGTDDEKLIPFSDPQTVRSVCLFDLSEAPLRIKVHIQDGPLLTLSFRTKEGRVFYAMTDRAALHNTIDIRLVTDAQLQQIESAEEDQGLTSELRLKAPSSKGMIVATTLVTRPADKQDAEDRIRAVECKPEPLPPQ